MLPPFASKAESAGDWQEMRKRSLCFPLSLAFAFALRGFAIALSFALAIAIAFAIQKFWGWGGNQLINIMDRGRSRRERLSAPDSRPSPFTSMRTSPQTSRVYPRLDLININEF